MEIRTANIIRLSQDRYLEYLEKTPIERIVSYLTRVCCPGEDMYTDYENGILLRVLKNAVYDYIDTCDKPSEFLLSFEETKRAHNKFTEIKNIIHAFSCIKTESNGRYINGFTDELINNKDFTE